MKEPHILLLNKNVAELRKQLVGILSARSVRALDAEIKVNVIQLFKLGDEHYRFASTLHNLHWRQIISRSYYAAYNISKAVRLMVNGSYSKETKDHENVGQLPDDFPNKNTYANRLRILRDDRNLCDYDHTATEGDLAFPVADYLKLVDDFIIDTRKYLKSRRIKV
jgi:hypothetical protein